jgi:WD40 repeat protein
MSGQTLAALVTFFVGLSGLLTTASEGKYPVITADNAEQVTLLAELPVQQLASFAWSPDGSTLAVSSQENIYVYNLSDFSLASTIQMGSLWKLFYRPDGTLIALRTREEHSNASARQIIQLVDVKAEKQLAELRVDAQFISAVALNHDRTLLALGDDQNQIQIWDLVHAKQIGLLKGHEVPPSTLAFSDDSRFLASGAGTGDHLLFVWDVGTSSQLRLLSGNSTDFDIPAEVLAFSPDGQWLVAGTSHGDPLVRWNISALPFRTGSGEPLISGLGSVSDLAFSPDSRLLAAVYNPPTFPTAAYIRLVDIATGTTRLEWRVEHTPVRLSFSANGKFLATVNEDKAAIQLWGIQPTTDCASETPSPPTCSP